MRQFRKSPFKANRRENDPNAFGLRVKEIVESAEALYNYRSVMLSGPRGIGKSSLGDQLQILLAGNNTLLKRCGYDTKFPKTLCIYYPCSSEITLSQLVLDILYQLEREVLVISDGQPTTIKPSIEVNLGVIKAKIETERTSKSRSPSTIAAQFVAGIEMLYRGLTRMMYRGINIFLDELDQLPDEIEFGSFIKIVHETLDRKNLSQVTFIFVGQQGIYTRFLKEHPSFERIVRYIPLSILDDEAAEHVITYAARNASPPFEIEQGARELLLGLASGYPDILHLVGNAAFLEMSNERVMTQEDVLRGVEIVLMSDRREKYLGILKELPEDELIVINALSRIDTDTLPAYIPYYWISDKLSFRFSGQSLVTTINLLVQKGYLIKNERERYYRFAEELFRIFLNMINMERRELRAVREKRQNDLLTMQKREEELQKMIRSGDVGDIDDRKYLEPLDLDEEKRLVALLVADSQDNWKFSDGKSLGELDSVVRSRILREVRNLLLGLSYIQDFESEIDHLVYDIDEDDIDRIYDDYLDETELNWLEDDDDDFDQ